MTNVTEQNDKQLLSFIATTVETLRDEMATIRSDIATMRAEMVTKDELATQLENLRDDMREELRQEIGASRQEIGALRQEIGALRQETGALRQENGALRQQMATKDDLTRLETQVAGDFEQVHLRFDNLERVMTTRFGFVETEVSRLRSAVYLLGRDRPDVLRLLRQPTIAQKTPLACSPACN
jgi:regulator of replication initiation timing